MDLGGQAEVCDQLLVVNVVAAQARAAQKRPGPRIGEGAAGCEENRSGCL